MELKLALQLNRLLRKIIREEVARQGAKPHSYKKNSSAVNRNNKKNPFTKIGWLKGDKKFQKFFDLLIPHGFIGVNQKNFKQNFFGSGNFIKVMWLSTLTHLVYLFDRLAENGFIPEHTDIHSLLSNHFLDRFGNEIKRENLRSLLNQVRQERVVIIDKLLKELEVE